MTLFGLLTSLHSLPNNHKRNPQIIIQLVKMLKVESACLYLYEIRQLD